jgi:hypothetical protein
MYDFKTFKFGACGHERREDGMCIMEAVAYLAGEEHTDRPVCASRLIGQLCIWVNDSADDQLRNELLRPLPWRLVGTAAGIRIERKRAYMAVDWAVHFFLPLILEEGGFHEAARQLKERPHVSSSRAAEAAGKALNKLGEDSVSDDGTFFDFGCALFSVADAATDAAKGMVAEAADSLVVGLQCAHNVRLVNEVITACVQLIDQLIRLTEPQECVGCLPEPVAAV